MKTNLDCRYIARILLEAQTPLFVGSGNSSLLKDALVQKDFFGLPIIPGTALTGVLRHAIEDYDNSKRWEELFGYQKGNEGLGSRLKISSAYFLSGKQQVAHSLGHTIDPKVMQKLDNLPTRQHVRINDKGVSVKNGLFDNEVVYKGARFLFEIELKGTEQDSDNWNKLIATINSPLFRIGQGTRNGYGKLGILRIYNRKFNLNNSVDFDAYLNFDPSFNSKLELTAFEPTLYESNLNHYRLELNPDDFFIFSKGSGDDEADNKPLTEEIITYEENEIRFSEQTVIPASSIKGALSHRTCYHYNKLQKKFADEAAGETGISNEAVRQLFGSHEGDQAARGNIILDDLYIPKDEINNDKIINHVAIDRFTGGAMDSALFSEKVSYTNKRKLVLHVFLAIENMAGNDKIIKALEMSLEDICKGFLPLGGMTTKGYGMFTGRLLKNCEKIFDYNETVSV